MSTYNIHAHAKKRYNPRKKMFTWTIRRISLGLKNGFESATINGPSVFESLTFYCTWKTNLRRRFLWRTISCNQPISTAFQNRRCTIQNKIYTWYIRSCSRTMWIISIGLLDPLTCRQSSMFGTFSASVYDREFHDQERSKLWAQPCRRSEGGYPSYRLPDSSGVCVVVVWPA